MKPAIVILSLSLVAFGTSSAIAAPVTTQLQSSASTRFHSFELLDPATGKVIGILVPIIEARDRVQGRRQPSAETPLPIANDLLTPLQLSQQRSQQLDEEFHVDHSP
ncbi:MAG: hypothetical protein JO043_05845 [Candidatus Eremiobacteraeota bacterium]|nr:hypothetical protein [Candidatus Eremiobacteraeota bacterium]